MNEGCGRVLKRFWEGFGKVLERFWKDFGRVLERFWMEFEKIWGRKADHDYGDHGHVNREVLIIGRVVGWSGGIPKSLPCGENGELPGPF